MRVLKCITVVFGYDARTSSKTKKQFYGLIWREVISQCTRSREYIRDSRYLVAGLCE